MFKRKTAQDIAEMARDKLQSYGFRCDNINTHLASQRNSESSDGRVIVTFDSEMATGMAAFSQYQATPGAHFYIEQLKGLDMASAEDWMSGKIDGEDIAVRLSVHYNHHSGGTNGIDRTFKLNHGGDRLVEAE